jgi:isoquinoline 1-oxidoreductase alpha subunit
MAKESLMPRIRINGVEHDIDADAQRPVLWAIRDIVHLTGTEFGCGAGACGRCPSIRSS